MPINKDSSTREVRSKLISPYKTSPGTLPRLMLLTLPWQMPNSLAFPGFSEKQPPFILLCSSPRTADT